jgi:hypothetical protein
MVLQMDAMYYDLGIYMHDGTMKILSSKENKQQKEKKVYDEVNFVPIDFFVANSWVCTFLLSMKQHYSMNE